MASFVLLNPSVVMNSRTISGWCSAVDINVDITLTDVTPFDDDWEVYTSEGRKRWSMTLQLRQDFDATQVDSFFFPLVGEIVTVAVRPFSTALGANNPQYSGSAIVLSYPILGNSVGELAESTVVLRGTGALVRAVS